MPNEEDLEILQKTYDRWTTGFCLSSAILEDYAEQLSKLNNEKVEDIKKRVLDKAGLNVKKLKEETSNYF